MQQRALGVGRAQGRLGLLPAQQRERQRGRMGPQQHLGEVVQQRGLVDQRGIVVAPVHREAQRKTCCPVRSAQHLTQARQRLGPAGQQRLHRGLGPEGAEKRRDAQHHQRLGGGLSVRLVATPAQHGDMAQQLQRHQRVAVHALGQQVGVDRVLIGAPLFDGVGGGGQHRDVEPVERGRPGSGVAQWRVDEGGVGIDRWGGGHGTPREE